MEKILRANAHSDLNFKILILGDSSVGKTSILVRECSG